MAVTISATRRALRVGRQHVAAALWAWRAELLQAAGTLAGWALVTAFVAHLTSPAAWTLSAGLLVLSLCGWNYLGRLAWFGLYRLTHEEEGRRGS